MTTDLCPECGSQLEFDEVDIGVGIQRGNAGCPECGWTEKRLYACGHCGSTLQIDGEIIHLNNCRGTEE